METYESGLINPAQRKALMDALEKGSHDPSFLSSISGGGPVEEFEMAFAKETGGRYALALSSCTAALHTALMAFGIGPGDEVIVSPYTWGQSVSPVLFVGATAVFADIDPDTLNIDPKSVEDRVSARTKAIIPVHLFGNPSDMDSLSAIATKHGLAIIGDTAQAFGALSKGRKIGSLGHAACFSLGRGKAVCGGEGGVLVTNDEFLYERAIAISQHPLRAVREVLTEHDFPLSDQLSLNYRIHPLAAVLALADLEVADENIAHRKAILSVFQQEIESIPGLKAIYCCPGDSSAAYGLPMTYNPLETEGISRESFVESLQLKGIIIQLGPVRIPIHLRTTFQQGRKSWLGIAPHASHRKKSCPVAETRCDHQELQRYCGSALEKIRRNSGETVLSIRN